MNKLFLWLVSLLNPLWSRLGADPKAIGLILAAKLKMDDRGGFAMGKRQQKKKGMEYLTYLFVGLMGLFLVMLFKVAGDPATAVGLGFCMWVCYIGLMLITEMSENLFDQRDLYVLLSRPINDLTLSLSRMLHIAVFASKFGLALGVPTLIYLAVTSGVWPALVYLFLGVLTVVITMTGTLVFYLILLRRVPSGRVKKIVGYFQILATFVFFLAYQLPSILGDYISLEGIRLVDTPVGFSFPGLWLGGLYKVLTTGEAGWMAYAQAILALVAAGGGLWFYVRQSRGYAERLLSLRHAGSTDGGGEKKTSAKPTKSGLTVRDRLAAWLTRPNQERVSFNFHWNMMVRDMAFKQRTYPSLVYMPVFLGITVLRDLFSNTEEFVFGDGMMVTMLYFLMWVVVIPLGQTKISEDYRASWIFSATPNAYPDRIMYGQLMAVLAMFYLPLALLTYGVALAYWGIMLLPDVVLAAGSTVVFSMIYNQLDPAPPFSRSKEDSKFQNFGPFLLIGLLAALFGGGHYLLRYLPYMVPFVAVIVWGVLLAWIWKMRTSNSPAGIGVLTETL